LYGGVRSYYKMCISYQIILGSLKGRVASALMNPYKSLLKEGYFEKFCMTLWTRFSWRRVGSSDRVL